MNIKAWRSLAVLLVLGSLAWALVIGVWFGLGWAISMGWPAVVPLALVILAVWLWLGRGKSAGTR